MTEPLHIADPAFHRLTLCGRSRHGRRAVYPDQTRGQSDLCPDCNRVLIGNPLINPPEPVASPYATT